LNLLITPILVNYDGSGQLLAEINYLEMWSSIHVSESDLLNTFREPV